MAYERGRAGSGTLNEKRARTRTRSASRSLARTYIAAGGNVWLSLVRFPWRYQISVEIQAGWREHVYPLTSQPAEGTRTGSVGVTVSWRPARTSSSACRGRGLRSRFPAIAIFSAKKSLSDLRMQRFAPVNASLSVLVTMEKSGNPKIKAWVFCAGTES